jgi:SAM-dependent methyltransferase
LAEFTGERVIPNQVGVDLWNEHFSRYAFASRFTAGKRVLDLGCGSGYGSAYLARRAATVFAADISAQALEYAGKHYPLPNLHFVRASCAALPAREAYFDVIVAFEVIEHLDHWETFLDDVRRVLGPGGLFIISTPNKNYYTASRGTSGPNPYHIHEFGFEEFRLELEERFPHVAMFVQNHVDGFAFQPERPLAEPALVIERADAAPDESNFFLAVCSSSLPGGTGPFVYVPRAANVLRERELHIEMLERLLSELQQQKHELVEMFRLQKAELEERNRWAASLDEQLHAAKSRIVELQDELAEEQAAASARIRELEQESAKNADWALRLDAELRGKCEELAECVRLLDRAEVTVGERTEWAQRLDSELRSLEMQLDLARASRWLRLGRLLGIGPELRKS